jgi:hypothetical protein
MVLVFVTLVLCSPFVALFCSLFRLFLCSPLVLIPCSSFMLLTARTLKLAQATPHVTEPVGDGSVLQTANPGPTGWKEKVTDEMGSTSGSVSCLAITRLAGWPKPTASP